MTFPELARKPSIACGPPTYQDPAIRSARDGGYVFTRPRFARVPRSWAIAYPAAPASDFEALDAFVRSADILGGSGSFDFTLPPLTDGDAGEVVTVRFAEGKLPTYAPAGFIPLPEGGQTRAYNISFEIEEV